MKKNLVFKLGLFCAALVLIATCFVSSAWAKYTQFVTASDTARVAKWTVNMDANSGETYEHNASFSLFDTNFKNITLDGTNKKGTEKLIAPGSKGEFSFVVNSTSEVSVQFDFAVAVTNANNIPLTWTVKVGAEQVYTGNDLVNGIKSANLLYKVNSTSDPDISGYKSVSGEQTITVSWNWAYENNDAGNTADTNLGIAGSATYTVVLSMTATQVAPVL